MKASSEEIYGKSTQGTQYWKVHSLGYNAVGDNEVYLHSFSCCWIPICEIPRSSPKIRTYGSSRSSRSSILVPIKSAYTTSY